MDHPIPARGAGQPDRLLRLVSDLDTAAVVAGGLDPASLRGIRRAESIRRMRGSGSALDPSRHLRLDENGRLQAVQRAASRLPRPVDRRRWSVVRDAIADNDRDRLREACAAAVCLALPAYGDGGDETARLRPFRRALNDAVTEDLAGPAWRRRSEGREVPLPPDMAPQHDPTDDLDARITLDKLALQLSPRQAEVLALLRTGHSLREAAERLGIAPATARRHLARIREKSHVHVLLAPAAVE